MLILNMVSILRLYVTYKNYKCDNPKCPPICAFIRPKVIVVHIDVRFGHGKKSI
jgi:hypothetical protein